MMVLINGEGTVMRTISSLCLVAMLLLVIGSSPAPPAQAVAPLNLLPNASFELGEDPGPDSTPTGWERDVFDPSAVLTWDTEHALVGEQSVKISAATPNDARWITTVHLQPQTRYLLSGWIKTEQVGHSAQSVDAGANLSLLGTWERTPGIFGTTDWTYVHMRFQTGDQGMVSIGARLGYWSGTTTGTAWFDGLRITPIDHSGPVPNWKILVLIYERTELTFLDDHGIERHLIAQMSAVERERAAREATAFVTSDLPALTSGMMTPTITIRYPGTLPSLSRTGAGWWPAPGDTRADRDQNFDSVIVIWDPRTIDQNTGERIWIGTAAGLTSHMGTGQTYYAQIIESTGYGHRNVFKHEWGHSILFYFEALGASPLPIVTNHAEEGQYVHCPTGEQYIWIDETEANPIPNSIYNNHSGFTHDYYSGTVATADQPTRCLGIPYEAWAAGGPVSHHGVYPYYHQFSLAAEHLEATAAPGTAAIHEIRLTNTGNLTDTFRIDAPASTWPLDAPADTGPIGPRQQGAIVVTVDIPINAIGGSSAQGRLSLTSTNDPDQTTDVALTTYAKQRYGLQLQPGPTEQIGTPGATVHYTLALTNTGNLTDTIAIAFRGNRWPTELPTQPIELARDEQTVITVDVTIPRDAAAGTADSVTVLATSQGGEFQVSVTLTSRTPAPAPVYRIWLPHMRGASRLSTQ
jgi:hypothetical protein